MLRPRSRRAAEQAPAVVQVLFDNLREDWRTYGHDPARQGLWVMIVYRFGRWRYTVRPRLVRLPFSFLYKVLKPISEILTGIELPCEVTLGRRFRIDHFGGIIISGYAKFGDNCRIRDGVHLLPVERRGEVPR